MPNNILELMERQFLEDEQQTAREEKTYQNLLGELDQAERKAFDALSRYKFQMFGYWAAIWVHLNRISGAKRQNPFRSLVNAARIQKVGYE